MFTCSVKTNKNFRVPIITILIFKNFTMGEVILHKGHNNLARKPIAKWNLPMSDKVAESDKIVEAIIDQPLCAKYFPSQFD